MNGPPLHWHEDDGAHIDVRGLPPPQPLVAILRLVQRCSAATPVIVHHDRDPQLLYPELAEIGWRAERIAGQPGEVRLLLDGRAVSSPRGGFLGGAKSRLLPASIPLRFFGAAVAFHVLAWLALLAGAADWPGFAGGLGWPLAALHLVTLGVLVMTAIGASLQLLPVATRQPLAAHALAGAVWWLYTPGVAALALGMGVPAPALLAAGAVRSSSASRSCSTRCCSRANLHRRARHAGRRRARLGRARRAGRAARHRAVAGRRLRSALPLLARGTALALHVAFAALRLHGHARARASPTSWCRCSRCRPRPTRGRSSRRCALAVAALALRRRRGARRGAAARCAWPRSAPARSPSALHLQLMRRALRDGHAARLGRSFALVRSAGPGSSPSLVLALGRRARCAASPACRPLFGLLLVGVWLLSFLLGMLQRILPFLASMHAAAGKRRRADALLAHRGRGRSPSTSPAIWRRWRCSRSPIVADSPLLAELAAAAGTSARAAFAVFFAVAAAAHAAALRARPAVAGARADVA